MYSLINIHNFISKYFYKNIIKKIIITFNLFVFFLLLFIVTRVVYINSSFINLEKNHLVSPVILTIKGRTLSTKESKLFKNANPFGFLLHAHNFYSQKQVKTLIKNLRSLFPNRKIYIAIDQEGGVVDRLRKIGYNKEKSARYFGDLSKQNFQKAKKEIYLNALNTSLILKNLGFDINFAPMVDLGNEQTYRKDTNSWDDIISRTYSNESTIVIKLAGEYIKASKQAGIYTSIKHIPGHGASFIDTHNDEAIIDKSLKNLFLEDFKPFIKLSQKVQFAMINHVTYKSIDNLPASMSKKTIKIIRDDFKFAGFIISDALNMKALDSFSLQERVKKSLDAGVDIVIPNYSSLLSVKKAIEAIDKNTIISFNKKLKKNNL